MASLDTLEPFGAAGREGLLPGSILGVSRASHCQGTMQGGIPAPVTVPGREEKKGGCFLLGVLNLPVTVFSGKRSTAGSIRTSQALPGMGNSGKVEVSRGEIENCHGLECPEHSSSSPCPVGTGAPARFGAGVGTWRQ